MRRVCVRECSVQSDSGHDGQPCAVGLLFYPVQDDTVKRDGNRICLIGLASAGS